MRLKSVYLLISEFNIAVKHWSHIRRNNCVFSFGDKETEIRLQNEFQNCPTNNPHILESLMQAINLLGSKSANINKNIRLHLTVLIRLISVHLPIVFFILPSAVFSKHVIFAVKMKVVDSK